MSSINEIVIVNITKDTLGQKRKGFSTPLVLGLNLTAGIVGTFVDKQGVADAVTGGENTEEYKIAEMIFAQAPRVEKIMIGKHSELTVTESLTAINNVSGAWYGLVLSNDIADATIETALWVENNEKLFFPITDDSDVVDLSDANDTTTDAHLLKVAKYERTMLTYAIDASQYTNVGIMGRILPLDAGTYTAKFKTIITGVVDDLSSTQSFNAREKLCNTYEEVGGRNIYREGTTSSGEFVDVIIFVDWLKARMAEDVYATLAKNDKVPYTDQGIQLISNSMMQSLETGLNRGAISPEIYDDNDLQVGGYIIEVPRLIDTDQTDRQNRLLRDVKFQAWLSGAIHKVIINGTVTV